MQRPLTSMESTASAFLAKVDAAGKPTQVVLGKVGSNALKVFDTIESLEFVTAWVDEASGLLKEVELPRLGLQFEVREVRGEARAYSVEHPWWYIPSDRANEKKQYCPGLAGL